MIYASKIIKTNKSLLHYFVKQPNTIFLSKNKAFLWTKGLFIFLKKSFILP